MSKITENELKKQIKSRSFAPVYLIYGSEQLYVKSYTEKLKNAVTDNSPSDFNFHTFEGDFNLSEFDAATQVMPFVSEFNCVLLEDAFFDLWRKDEPKDYFLDIISRVGGSTVLIISMPSYVPKSNAKYFEKVIKKVEKLGAVCEFPKLDDRTIEKHIAKWAGEQGKLFTRVGINRLMNLCGKDLNCLKNETAKICAYAQGEEITQEDISAVVIPNLESRIFDLSDAIVRKNADRAYKILDNLFYQQEEPVPMLAVLGNAYIDLYRVKMAAECGVSNNRLASDFSYGNRAFLLNRITQTAKSMSGDALSRSIDAIMETDTRLKSENTDGRLLLEQLIAKLLIAGEKKNA